MPAYLVGNGGRTDGQGFVGQKVAVVCRRELKSEVYVIGVCIRGVQSTIASATRVVREED